DLRAGRGMGLALVAELNGYPGPMHVLCRPILPGFVQPAACEDARPDSRRRAEAIPLGHKLIAQVAEFELQRPRQLASCSPTRCPSSISLASRCNRESGKVVTETRNGAPSMPMSLIPNISVFRRKLAGFPIATYQAGETVVAAGSTTGR